MALQLGFAPVRVGTKENRGFRDKRARVIHETDSIARTAPMRTMSPFEIGYSLDFEANGA
jgi:hypothetical protein